MEWYLIQKTGTDAFTRLGCGSSWGRHLSSLVVAEVERSGQDEVEEGDRVDEEQFEWEAPSKVFE